MNDIKLMVCPHDTVRNPEGWYRMVQYMTATLNLNVHFELSLDFADFHQEIAQANLVYANPSDALRLMDQHGFKPLVRPTNIYDEAVIIAGTEGDLPSIDAINGATVASVENLLPTRIALKMLRERGLVPTGITHRDSWLSVVRSVWNGEAPFGILYRDAYEELSEQGRQMIRILEHTNEQLAFHMFVASPSTYNQIPTLAGLFTGMQNDAEGIEMLKAIFVPSWTAVSDDDITRMRVLFP